MMANRKWMVTINRSYRYVVDAPYAAEAEHEAVVKWRKDDNIDIGDRHVALSYIETQWLELFQG